VVGGGEEEEVRFRGRTRAQVAAVKRGTEARRTGNSHNESGSPTQSQHPII
jgi:hypothetical protein